jgi:hypothetical protein
MALWRSILTPDRICKKLSEFPFEELRSEGYQFALLDLDNTIAPDHSLLPDDYSKHVIQLLTRAGFECCIVSNAKSGRSSDFAQSLGVKCVTYAKKPSPSGMIRAMEMMQSNSTNTVMFGDQIFTDIIAAKRAGVLAILVEPYQKREMFYIMIKRPFEKLVRWFFRF